MITTPPFYLSGETGRALDTPRRTLQELHITDGKLTLCSFDVDQLTFTIDPRMGGILPDHEQWFTLWDDADQCLFSGKCRRQQDIPSMRYAYIAESIWMQSSNATVKGTDDRPYRVYQAQDLAITLRDLWMLAKDSGLQVQPPAASEMPTIYSVPKMALRSQSYVDGLITVAKYAPHISTRMDYATSPPTLRFIKRDPAAIKRLDLDVPGHGLTSAKLEPKDWLRAKGISIYYAQRLTQSRYTLGVQTAGDVTAETDRQIDLMLSGYERTDSLTSETLATAIASLADAQTALDAVGAAASSAASSASLPINYATFQAKDSRLAAYTMELCNGEVDKLFTNPASSGGSGYSQHATAQITVGGVTGTWYAIKDNAFTSEQLTLAGAVAVTGTLTAELRFRGAGAGSVPSGMYDIDSYAFSGYTQQDVPGNQFWYYVYVTSTINVTYVNMSPTAIAAAVVAAIEGKKSTLGDQANFVQPPADLAKNYFEAQNWTPLDGSMAFSPSAPWKPAPGDRVQIEGTYVDPEWGKGEALIRSITLDLNTGAVAASAGAPARQSVASLMDKLTVPAEDNFT